MALFEVETNAHIVITWAEDENQAKGQVYDNYPGDDIIRITKRPRMSWVISKAALGLTDGPLDPCLLARDCLAKAEGGQGPRDSALHARDGLRFEPSSASNRIEHGHGLVIATRNARRGGGFAGHEREI